MPLDSKHAVAMVVASLPLQKEIDVTEASKVESNWDMAWLEGQVGMATKTAFRTRAAHCDASSVGHYCGQCSVNGN